MAVGVEEEGAHLGVLVEAAGHGPAGDGAGKARHIGLAVAAVDAERVQLQELAGEVLVEAAAAALAGARRRPDRLAVVEIEQHGRMLLHRLQHGAEGAVDMRADGLALEGAGGEAQLLALGDGDAEMVGPEPDEALGEAELGLHRVRMRKATSSRKMRAAGGW